MTGSRLRIALLAATAMVFAGCGSAGPRLAHEDATQLLTLADRISREAPCAQARDIRALNARRTALVNAHRVPAALQEPLSSGVNALVALTPPCLPSVPAVTVTPPTVLPKHGKGKHGNGHGEGND